MLTIRLAATRAQPSRRRNDRDHERHLLSGPWPLGPHFGVQEGGVWQARDKMAVVDVGGRHRLVV